MVGAIALVRTMDVGLPAIFYPVSERKTPRIHTVSAWTARRPAGLARGGILHLQQLGRCRHWQRRIAGSQGGVVVGFLGTNGAGHEAPNVSCSGQIRARSPEISWSLGGSRELIRQSWATCSRFRHFGFSNVKLMPLSAFG